MLPLVFSLSLFARDPFVSPLKNATKDQIKALRIAQKYKLDNLLSPILDKRFRLHKRKKRKKLNKKLYFKLLDINKKIVVAEQILKSYNKPLKRAEKGFSVDKEAIATIIAIETHGGKFTGKYKMINALFSIHIRKGTFLNQLKALNRMVEKGFDPFTPSSFAGAFGYPQFLPYSYLKYGVDGNKDGKVDLFNMEDAIFSAANYLAKHGWKKDKRKAIFSYNPSSWYVEAFFNIYTSLKKTPQRFFLLPPYLILLWPNKTTDHH